MDEKPQDMGLDVHHRHYLRDGLLRSIVAFFRGAGIGCCLAGCQ